MRKYDRLIFEVSQPGHKGYALPDQEFSEMDYTSYFGDETLRKTEIEFPEVNETEVVRHYTALSNLNFGVDTGFYPLGSCTMKYNPKINEEMANNPKFSGIHPEQPVEDVQGTLELMQLASDSLAEVTGMDVMSLQPAAGSHGELTGLMIMKAYHLKNGQGHRKNIIVPDAAHGTNPASANVAGFKIIEIKSTANGAVDLDSLEEAIDENFAGLMLTNPSTLGLFEKNIEKITKMVHDAGGLLYYDGANMNAIMSQVRPGDMGFDIIHLNLHKTFSTPHGGGGPGAGPIGVKSFLEPFLPYPVLTKSEEKYTLDYDRPDSIGKIKNYFGNIGIIIRAYTYILSMGSDGLKRASEVAVLNANYLQTRLKEHYHLPIDELCKHEFVLSGNFGLTHGINTIDIAKRLIDYGFHPPTIYFPLIIDQAMMIEPTETESLENMDKFVDAMISIRKEIDEDPDLLHQAPSTTHITRIDELAAARNPIIVYRKQED
ncbi:glycine dehydrogenase subunit 2 [Acidaminobacter sp. JC074]|uniref:aminomethyl-transferring glycine dehydrogenase subunit GcvPB n=1 Tax=Acidaminobacter sp. JC074 TaxID=2530199 RepID=UPI001F0D1884|nr:aminomethyl-transferring glycine dehydrogenase subunit GcvPB [Acidaminobacter sp. JC074]MCH4888864.1 glycine dehydrogenase subunit 2 [Acidaminobacter sp. JC074]